MNEFEIAKSRELKMRELEMHGKNDNDSDTPPRHSDHIIQDDKIQIDFSGNDRENEQS